MRIILIGPPGAGKGTQAQAIVKHFKIARIATGDMLRAAIQAGTSLGKAVKACVESGKLVPDNIIITLVEQRISRPDCEKGFLFDGFPRTLPQMRALRDIAIPIDCILELSVPDEIVLRRMTGRLLHPASGRVYHKDDFLSGRYIDAITGDPLIQRSDDTEETVRKRLAIYHELTEPLLDYCQGWAKEADGAPFFHKISGDASAKEVKEEIFSILQNIDNPKSRWKRWVSWLWTSCFKHLLSRENKPKKEIRLKTSAQKTIKDDKISTVSCSWNRNVKGNAATPEESEQMKKEEKYAQDL